MCLSPSLKWITDVQTVNHRILQRRNLQRICCPTLVHSAKPIIPHSKEKQMRLVRIMLAAFDVSLSSKNTNKKTEVVNCPRCCI